MTKEPYYRVVQNQKGEYAIQATGSGTIILKCKDLKEAEKICAEWNLTIEDVWKPVEVTK